MRNLVWAVGLSSGRFFPGFTEIFISRKSFQVFFLCVLRTNESRDLVIKYLAHEHYLFFFSPRSIH